MQVFIQANAAIENGQTQIYAFYPDDPPLPADLHGSKAGTMKVLTVPDQAIVRTDRGHALKDGWQESGGETAIKAEAQRRILAAFPEHAQRNATAVLQQAIMEHGLDDTQWPSELRNLKNAIAVGWTYIAAVRERARALMLQPPNDPTNDGHWPTVIGVVKV